METDKETAEESGLENETRVRQQTEKGQLFWKDNKRQAIKATLKRLKNKTSELDKSMNQGLTSTQVTAIHAEWLNLYDEFLELHREYTEIFLQKDETSEFEREIDMLKGFKQSVEEWLSANSKAGSPCGEIKTGDSVSQADYRTSMRRPSSRASRMSSSIASARLRELQNRAELQAKAEALKGLQSLELESIKLDMAKQALKIQTDIAVSDARAKVLDEYEENIEKSDLTRPKETYVGGTNAKNVPEFPYDKQIKQEVASQLKERTIQSNLNPQSQPFIMPQAPDTRYTDNANFATNLQNENEPRTCPPPFFQTNFTENTESAILSIVQHLRKPPPEIKRFAGDPLEYRRFIRQFETKVVMNSSSDDERLNYLEQFTEGEPNKIVSTYSYLNATQGYTAARKELEERYGREDVTAQAFVKRAMAWPSVKADNSKGLDEFAIFLAECGNAIKCIEAVKILEYPDNIMRLVSKLPYHCHDKWRNIVEQARTDGHSVKFDDLVNMVKHEARKATDPTYGKDVMSNILQTDKPQSKKASYVRTNRNTFVTNASESPQSESKGDNAGNSTLKNVTDKTSGIKGFTNRPCQYCESTLHSFHECEKFSKQTLSDRVEYLKAKRFCFGCLKRGHRKAECRSRVRCNVCHGLHATVLHDPDRQSEQTPVKALSNASHSARIQTGAGEGTCTMAVIPVQVKRKDSSKYIQTYAFLDPGSSVSFCTERLMRQLGAEGARMKITLDTMAKPATMNTYAVSNLQISDMDCKNTVEISKAYSKDRIPITKDHIPTNEDLSNWTHLEDIKLPSLTEEIGLLIGNNIADAYTPIEVRTGPRGSPYAVKTLLGWVVWNLVRQTQTGSQNNALPANRADIIALEQLDELRKLDILVRRSIDCDFPERVKDEKLEHSQEDKLFLQKVENSINLNDGHYEVCLPFRQPQVQLPNNKVQAMQRLNGLKRKMTRDKDYYSDYVAFMDNLLKNGYAEKVPDAEIERNDGKVWYVPHHGIYHPKKPGKIRVVFDCGAQHMGVSLNSLLLQGPDLTNSLLSVLLKFRQGSVAVMADIEAMFHQVRLPKDDCDCLRFCWWPSGDLQADPEIYRMRVHLFGAVSSPSCCNAALRQTAVDNENAFSQTAVDCVKQNFYVDDLLKSVDSTDDAIKMINDTTQLCQKGGFHLTKWSSNSSEVLRTIPQEERAKGLKELDLEKDLLPNERALGVHWQVEKDCLGFSIQLQERPVTRRGILSITSSIYDPLGISAPFTLTGRQLLQNLCKLDIGWDEEIPETQKLRWQQWLNEFPNLQDVTLPRSYKPTDFGHIVDKQLHLFSDASEAGYGVVAYLRQTDHLAKVHCSLVMAKSRVTPLKKITVPRLELTAASLAAKISLLIQKELGSLSKVMFWSDSMSVLRYIKSESGRFQTFVANRVTLIRDISSPKQWMYVDSKQNPADAASRGQKMKDFLANNQWFDGPTFLSLPEDQWPKLVPNCDLLHDDPEVKKSANAIVSPQTSPTDRYLLHFSDWWKLKRVTGLLLLAISNLKSWVALRKALDEDMKSSFPDAETRKAMVSKKMDMLKKEHLEMASHQVKSVKVSTDLLSQAESAIICLVQRQHFQDEINSLEKHCLKKKSSIAKLDPLIVDGVLRVGGRLERADVDFSAKHPALLPKDSPISKLILSDAHRSLGHLGKNYILSTVRQQYWILGASTLIKSMVSKCVTCQRYQGKGMTQKMSDLPADRLIPDEPPFTRVGMDFFGPFIVKRGRSIVKRYGVVFTCLATRAVHFEVAHSMDTSSCIDAIRRLISRRGPVRVIRCDNGTNLVGSKRELSEEIEKWNQVHISAHLQQKGISWEFNPPGGSHFGGVWERIIRTARKVFYSLLHDQMVKLDDESLQTLFCEIESILNSRPLTELPTSPTDLKPLTPNDLLLLKAGECLPPGLFDKNDLYVRRRWKQVQYLADVFWKRWVKQYLPLLQQRQKWNFPKRNVAVDDLVLLVDNTPRSSWALGRVLEVMRDSKGFVRMVKVKTVSSVLIRPTDKLCVLLEAQSPSK